MFHQAGGMQRLIVVCLLECSNMVSIFFCFLNVFLKVLIEGILELLYGNYFFKSVQIIIFFPSFLLGYEMYTTMRADPCLCFLERCGRPDDQDIKAEQHSADPDLRDG